MTVQDESRRRRRQRSTRRQRIGRIALAILALALAFLLGLAFAETLEDRPTTGGTVTTDVRTLTPLPQGAPTRTVTVTATTTP